MKPQPLGDIAALLRNNHQNISHRKPNIFLAKLLIFTGLITHRN